MCPHVTSVPLVVALSPRSESLSGPHPYGSVEESQHEVAHDESGRAGRVSWRLVLAACGGSDTPTASTTSAPSAAAGASRRSRRPVRPPESPRRRPSNTDPSAPPTIDENADLVIWTAQLESSAIQAAADKFAADNGITVSVQIVADGRPAFLNASQAGQAPDLINGAHDWIGQLVQNGAIDPVQLDAATQAKFNPLAIEGVTFNGQIYGVPYDLGNIFLIRNTDLAPDAPTSIEDMVATGKQLVADGKASEIMALAGRARTATRTTCTRSSPPAAATSSVRQPTATTTRRTSG